MNDVNVGENNTIDSSAVDLLKFKERKLFTLNQRRETLHSKPNKRPTLKSRDANLCKKARVANSLTPEMQTLYAMCTLKPEMRIETSLQKLVLHSRVKERVFQKFLLNAL